MEAIRVRITVNGEERIRTVPSTMTLLEFLREDLQLTGTKEGCGKGECGACTVLLEAAGDVMPGAGVPCAGCSVTTIECARRAAAAAATTGHRIEPHRRRRSPAPPRAAGVHRSRRHPVRFLHTGDGDVGGGAARTQPVPHGARDPHRHIGQSVQVHGLPVDSRSDSLGGVCAPDPTAYVKVT